MSVNNRVLAKVNGKAISVVDLMKKMDILFYREFPQYTSIPEARFQFYEANWKHLLQELVDKELILADAEENKLPVTSGDVRQEMERLFGPNIIGNLDKIGMTYDEAWKIIQGDILLHRMLYVRVNAKAMRQVTPSDVRTFYEGYAKENMIPDRWSYQVISIRDKDSSSAATSANIAYQHLKEDKLPINEVIEKIKLLPLAKASQMSVSELYSHTDKELSPVYKEILQKMESGDYSKPVIQKSKDKSLVFRIFYLQKMTPGGPPLFKDVENKIKDKLIENEISEKSQVYLKKLRQHFDIQEMIPEDFQPFELK
ncbi:MAG: peptidyl-prolyl cis-trans isomerase [Parachlamydiaceae bacterium]|nr:peptidyl-prolyl cis-trans isomerase [Parachlamydiaceae bacterium]